MKHKGFKWRSFVSFSMFFSFFVMGISGLVLFIAPPGRVFRWTDWHFLWVDLDQWQSLHTLFSYLFLGFGIVHVFSLNWKVLLAYFTRKSKQGLQRKRELLSSALVIVLFAFGTLFKIPPFQSIMDLGSWASGSWGESIDYPPVAHIEEMTLEEIASVLLQIDVDEFLGRIKKSGYVIDDPAQTLGEVCDMNKVAPYVFFRKTTEGMNVLVIPAEK